MILCFKLVGFTVYFCISLLACVAIACRCFCCCGVVTVVVAYVHYEVVRCTATGATTIACVDAAVVLAMNA